MQNRLTDKSDVESMPLGSWQISVSGVHDWSQEDIEILKAAVFDIQDNVAQKAMACKFIRLVRFTGDIENELITWKVALGRSVPSSSDQNSAVAGTTFTWGDGQPETTFSVIVLQERFAIGLLGDASEFEQALAKTVLSHEFGHVHDDFCRLNIFGPESPVFANDWPGIRRANAESAWAEYFAESLAYPYMTIDMISEHMGLAFTMVKSCVEGITTELINHKASRDTAYLWNYTCSQISKTLNQLGRIVGVLSQIPSQEALELFRKGMGVISKGWSDFFGRLYDELQSMRTLAEQAWSLNFFDSLATLVADMFDLCGIRILYDANGLAIDTR